MFSAAPKKHVSLRLIPVLAGIAALVFLWFSADRIDSGNQAKEKEIISTALSRSITQCYALEGTYPPNLDYLVQNYGLTYNKDVYFIDYKYIGSNLRPDVTIIERNPDDRAE